MHKSVNALYHNNRATSKIPQPKRKSSVTPSQNHYNELPKLKQNVTLPVIKTYSRNQNNGGDNNNNNFQKPPPTSVSLNSINSERMQQLEPRLRSEQSFIRNWPDKMKSVREKAKQRAIAVQELKDQKAYLFEQLQRKQTELNFIQHEQQQEKVNELSRSESSMSNKNYSGFNNFGPPPKFGHFCGFRSEVFAENFSAQKSIFQNCPVKRARRASRTNFRNLHSKIVERTV